ncbi:hypothetical protein DX932_17660 [Bacillus cereus]|uniref:Uncharacterized protein n=1 Tax=Bacillus cereus TaxID=1396 RepID=A0A9W7UQS7_BACCE|nr:hypothetical protein [Bacillus cereus]KAA6462801.1 hypothetical protein DX932_17660 [Bacillus cereus]KAB2504701.1 hypothetical protein F8156_08440 [Bacillus cereus]
MKVLVTQEFENKLREIKNKSDIMSVMEFVNQLENIKSSKEVKSHYALKKIFNIDDIYVYRINKNLRVFLSFNNEKNGREVLLLVSVSVREMMSNEILHNFFNNHSIEVLNNKLKKIIDLLDQSLFNYSDSCIGASEFKYYRTDANIPVHLYEELVEVINDINDEVANNNVLKTINKKDIITILKLLESNSPIRKLALFNQERHLSELITENYFENLDDSVDYATQRSFEKLEELADNARESAEELIKLLNKLLSDLEDLTV